jgi:hypothetical protein
MNSLDINENQKIDNEFNQCYDSLNVKSNNSVDYLRSDDDNILLIVQLKTVYGVNCYSREYIRNIMRYNRQFCNPLGGNGVKTLYGHINVGGIECFLSFVELQKILDTEHDIYYLEKGENKIQCVMNQLQDNYIIKVCGGENCLEKIIREEIEEEEEEEEDLTGLPIHPGPKVVTIDQDEDDYDEEDFDPEFDYDRVEEFFYEILEEIEFGSDDNEIIDELNDFEDYIREEILKFKTERGKSILSLAIEFGHLDLAIYILEYQGIDPNIFWPNIIVAAVNNLNGLNFERIMKIMLGLDDNLNIVQDRGEIKNFYKEIIVLDDQEVYDNIFEYLYSLNDDIPDKNQKIQFVNDYITINNLPEI